MNILSLLSVVSGISFLIYGITHFTSPKMKNEFKRFKLEKFGFTTAVFELLGGSGLIAGLFYTPLIILSSFGLTVLMFAGLIVRINVKDKFSDFFPVIFFIVLNSFIFFIALKKL